MILSEEQTKVKALLTEAITVLCKNGLQYREEFSIEGLLGITLDNEDVFLISINEMIKNDLAPSSVPKMTPIHRHTVSKPRPSLPKAPQSKPHKRPFHAVSSSVQHSSQSPHSSTQVASSSSQDSSEPAAKKLSSVERVVEIESDDETGGDERFNVKSERSEVTSHHEEQHFPPEPGEAPSTPQSSVPNPSDNDPPAQPNDSVPNFGDELNISDMSVNLKSEPGLALEPGSSSATGDPSQAMMNSSLEGDVMPVEVLEIVPKLFADSVEESKVMSLQASKVKDYCQVRIYNYAKKKKVYEEEQLITAINLVEKEGYSVLEASKLTNVPRTSIYSRMRRAGLKQPSIPDHWLNS